MKAKDIPFIKQRTHPKESGRFFRAQGYLKGETEARLEFEGDDVKQFLQVVDEILETMEYHKLNIESVMFKSYAGTLERVNGKWEGGLERMDGEDEE